jgi:outer membrane protein OmpA-like peptidoglycan-associated protein
VAPPHLQRAPQAAAPAPRFDQVQKERREHVEDGGRRTVIQEPGNRVIVKQDNRVIIQHDDAERFRRIRDARTERRPDGVVETFYVRPDGFRVVTEVDANGRLVRRYRRGPDGREFAIIDNRRFLRNAAIGIGVGAIGVAIALNLPPPTVTIPRERYIVDYERASDDDLYETLSAPPVDRLERSYSLEEVRYNYELRERMRRIDLDAITFAFGAFEVAPDEYPKLERLARVILRVLERNPDEVFLIEGHTDAVGSDVDNLSLSDRRAEAVAQILTETFGVPPENLVTQGYGKQYLKIDTPQPERANRRVAVRRITPLMSER